MRDFMRKIPLTPKMLFLTACLGLIVWGIQDFFSTRHIKTISDEHLNEMLLVQAQEDRIRFDNYVEMYHRLLTMVVDQKSFADYILHKKWPAGSGADPQLYEEPPPWLPDSFVTHRFVRLHYALLLDGASTVREIYKACPEALPPSLLMPSHRLIQMSHDQSLLIALDGAPFLLASEPVLDARGNREATLIFVARLNDDFLIASQGLTSGNKLFGLASGSPARLIACSRPDLLASGIRMDLLHDDYVVFKKSFFDMGSSELMLEFVSFMARAEFDKMNESLLRRERTQRTILSFFFILTSAIIIFWITKQIQRLARRIAAVSKSTLNISPPLARQGDELGISGGSGLPYQW